MRSSAAVRGLARETTLTPDKLVLPLFLVEGEDKREPIEAMPGVERHSVDSAIALCEKAMAQGVASFALFPKVPDAHKTPGGEEALNKSNLVCVALERMKRALPEACLIADVALDPYSSLGHDGVVKDGKVANDESVALLAKMAVVQAQAGADAVAPSDMMDGRVGAIRTALDQAGETDTLLISYTAKYASAFYGPFRSALDSAPVEAADVPPDKATYQMDPANAREALTEAALDEAEGADVLMVKPGLPYLDVISALRRATALPVAAYHVSGEYAMLKAAHERGWLDYERCLVESLTALARAGADIVFTYGALDYARWFRSKYA